MIKVVPFIQTTGSEKFKQFLALSFTIDMLYPVFNEKSCETLFEGWHCKNMMNWYRFTNDDKIILEFYPKHYVKYILSIPVTINDFINDIERFGIQLYWMDWIDKNFEPKEYLHVNEIKNYYIDLLTKMGKSNELQ